MKRQWQWLLMRLGIRKPEPMVCIRVAVDTQKFGFSAEQAIEALKRLGKAGYSFKP